MARSPETFYSQEPVLVPWIPHDRDHARLTSKLRPGTREFTELPLTITRGQIARFCEPCNNFDEKTQRCITLSEPDQIRNAARQFCGRATVYAEPAHMTAKGPELVRFDF